MVALGAVACSGAGGSPCGPTEAVVARVIDGDTVELETGENVRYLMIDTPESTNGATDCYGAEAKQLNEQLVAGKRVTLAYDVECEDRFGRLLAFVSVAGREVNTILVERGYACVLIIPPNGADREEEFLTLEAIAEMQGAGMWGVCSVVTCD
jgi:micrococcal nuclease